MDSMRFLAWVSGLGLFGSAVWHIAALLGYPLPQGVTVGLFIGTFVVLFPAFLAAREHRSRVPLSSRDWWKTTFDGAPTWYVVFTIYVGIYAALNLVIRTGRTRVSSSDPQWQPTASGAALYLYAVATGIFVAAAARARTARQRDTVSVDTAE